MQEPLPVISIRVADQLKNLGLHVANSSRCGLRSLSGAPDTGTGTGTGTV
jgi:hypothetical protein